jgi:predicted nucleic acid-binding protein
MMKKFLIDTSFLFALINQRDADHAKCLDFLKTHRISGLIPVTVIPETAYLLYRRLGHHVMRRFIQEIQHSEWDIEPLMMSDLTRAGRILDRYADSNLDFVDSTIVATAERMDIDTILTLDHRHFRMIRPKHIPNFTILPE